MRPDWRFSPFFRELDIWSGALFCVVGVVILLWLVILPLLGWLL